MDTNEIFKVLQASHYSTYMTKNKYTFSFKKRAFIVCPNFSAHINGTIQRVAKRNARIKVLTVYTKIKYESDLYWEIWESLEKRSKCTKKDIIESPIFSEKKLQLQSEIVDFVWDEEVHWAKLDKST